MRTSWILPQAVGQPSWYVDVLRVQSNTPRWAFSPAAGPLPTAHTTRYNSPVLVESTGPSLGSELGGVSGQVVRMRTPQHPISYQDGLPLQQTGPCLIQRIISSTSRPVHVKVVIHDQFRMRCSGSFICCWGGDRHNTR